MAELTDTRSHLILEVLKMLFAPVLVGNVCACHCGLCALSVCLCKISFLIFFL